MSIDRYMSNDWIAPIVEEAKPILAELPRESAIEVASAVLKGVDTDETAIPWVTVFPSDDRSQLASRLIRVLRTPDYQTPAYDPSTHLAVEELTNLLDSNNAVGHLGCHAAYYFVQAAAGNDEPFLTYQDLARKWPQYSGEWSRQLRDQFGDEGYDEVAAGDPNMALEFGRIAAIAEVHYKQSRSIRQDGESVVCMLSRAADFFDITTAEGLAEASRILSLGFEEYRKTGYQLRGLPAPV